MEKTRENDLVFEVVMSPKDQSAIISHIQALLDRLALTGIIFFFAVCIVMSIVIFFLCNTIAQVNIENDSLKTVTTQLTFILDAQRKNGKKLNTYLYKGNKEHIIEKHSVITKEIHDVIKVTKIVHIMQAAPSPNRNSRIYNYPVFPDWIYDKYNPKNYNRYNNRK